MIKMLKSSAGNIIKNSRMLFKLILDNEPIARNRLEDLSGLKLTTLVRAMNWLENSNLIHGTEVGESSGGRRPILYSVNPDAGYIIGVDISRTYTKIVKMDIKCNILDSETYGMFEESTPNLTLQRVASKINEFSSGIDKEKILGIGVGAVGPLDKERGIMLSPENFPTVGWETISIKDFLEKETGLITFVENGASAAALGEFRNGIGKGFKSIAYIISGIGLRLGVVVNGELMNNSTADESAFGHTIIDKELAEHSDGKKGGLESYTSIKAILNNFKSEIKKSKPSIAIEKVDYDLSAINLDVFCEAVERGDPLAMEIIADAADYFAMGLINIVSILSPELVTLGGPLIKKCNSFFELSTNMAKEKLQKITSTKARFSKGTLEENAIVIGAGNIVLDYYLL